MQGRLIKSGPLSEPEVVSLLNRDFVPVIVDPSASKNRGVAPGLRLWEKTYDSNWAYRLGYATTVILAPDGKIPLAASGIAKHHWRDVSASANHVPDEFLEMLDAAASRSDRYLAVQQANPDSPQGQQALRELQEEIILALQEVSRVHDGRTRSVPARAPRLN